MPEWGQVTMLGILYCFSVVGKYFTFVYRVNSKIEIMALTPNIKSVTHLDGNQWKMEVEMDLPPSSDFSIIPQNSPNPVEMLFDAQVANGDLSGMVILEITFFRVPGSDKIKVTAVNKEGDKEGDATYSFPD